jgi:hypothetical protein
MIYRNGRPVLGFSLGDASLTSDWTDEDLTAFLDFCQRLGIDDETVPLRVWAAESNNRPRAIGPGYASGVFSLTPSAAKSIGYDVVSDPDLSHFRTLPVREQLRWAERHYAKRKGPIHTVARLYTHNFLPDLVNRADNPDAILVKQGDPAYDSNWTRFDVKRDAAGRPIPDPFGTPQPDKGFIRVADLEAAAERATGPRTNELIERATALKESS